MDEQKPVEWDCRRLEGKITKEEAERALAALFCGGSMERYKELEREYLSGKVDTTVGKFEWYSDPE